MIGSPDLVAFTKETDYSEIAKDPLALPEELSVPMYPYTGDATPWSRLSGAKFKKDFILLSEFSEQVGPQPLLTVPPETKACGEFDLNHFSLRIMSVDYQTSLASPGGSGSLKLNFVEDSKVVLGDSKEGAFAYVHHFTLYDLEARGFVRPLCLAYVSSDENKIIQQFQQLSAEFSKVSECLKTGNRKNFANELEIKLRDLEYTRIMLLEKESKLNNASAMCTNEREPMLNGIPSLERKTADMKLKEKPYKDEIKLQEKDGCGNSRKAEVKSENENRSHTADERDAQFGERMKEKHNKGSCSMPLANKDEELASVEKSIQDHKNLLKQVTYYPTRKLRDSEYFPYEPDDSPHSLELDLDDLKYQLTGPTQECSVFPYTNAPSHTLQPNPSFYRFDKRLKTLEELCDDYFHQHALQQLHCIERSFRGDACHLYTHRLCRNLLCNLKSTNFLFEDPRDVDDEVGLQIGIAGQHAVRQSSFLPAPSILSEPVSLESYASCVEMVPIKLQLGGSSRSPVVHSSVTTPFEDCLPLTSNAPLAEAEMEDEIISATGCEENVEYVSALMKTSVSSGDSIEVLGTEKSFRSQGLNLPMDTPLQRPPPLPTAAFEGLRQGRVPTKRTCSEDSIEVLSTTESILPEELRASYPCVIDEESPEQESDEKGTSQNQEDKKGDCVYGVGNASEDHGGASMDEPSFYPAITLTPPADPMTLILGGSNSQDACHAAESIHVLSDEPCRSVPDDLSDCFSYRSTTASTTSESTFPSCSPREKREGGTRRRRGKMGRAALQFLRQFPFAVHAVFSLLSGRTLVVLGSEEAAVRRLVSALSVYMPHLSRYRDNIQPWTSTPLQLTDLLHWKLVGFNRTCCFNHTSLPHCLGHYSRYLSILDVDQKTLRSPTYSGALINLLVEPRSHFKRGNTYFMFAQSVQSKLVTKAFLLTFSRGHHTSRRSQENTECLLSEFHRDDQKVLHYLSELIKLHFIKVPPNVLRFSYTTNSIFKL